MKKRSPALEAVDCGVGRLLGKALGMVARFNLS